MTWANVARIGGSVLGGISGGKGEKSGGIPGTTKKMIRLGRNLVNEARDRPIEESVAGFTPDQLQAFQQIRDAQGMGQNDLGMIQSRINDRAANGVTEADIQRFMNPYTREVIDATAADMEHARQLTRRQTANEFEAAGAFGGDREAVYRGEVDAGYDRNFGTIAGSLRAAGYDSAVRNAMDNYGLQMSGDAQLQRLIEARRNAAYGDADALYNAGTAQQQLSQTEMDYILRLAGMYFSGAPGGQAQSTEGGGINGTMQGIIGGAQTGSDIYDIIKGMGGGAGDAGGWGVVS